MYWLFIINIILRRHEFLAARGWKTEKKGYKSCTLLATRKFQWGGSKNKTIPLSDT